MADDKRESGVPPGASSDDPRSAEETRQSHRRRDAEAITIIGAFFAVLALLVLIGVLVHRSEGMAVGVCAGSLLLLIGLGSVWTGMRWRRGLQ